jgi:RNA ligase
VHLHDLIDPDELAAAVAAKHVKIQTHPVHDGWRILNYTDACMWDKAWNRTTLACRGLIVDPLDMVIARPWRKFFNHAEHADATFDLGTRVEVTDKMDGSLAVLYQAPDGWAIATRGSFASEQALHATHLYRAKYVDTWMPDHRWTYLFEIIYAANRIVLDYGDLDDLVLLGAVHIATGDLAGPQDAPCHLWPGPRTAVMQHETLADALSATPRPNAEGMVVRYLDGPDKGLMLKLKQADYLALHRILTRLTARRLWERAAVHAVLDVDPETPLRRIGQALHLDVADIQGIVDLGPDWMDEIRKLAPEEFTAWIDGTVDGLRVQAASVAQEVAVVASALMGKPRKDAAAVIAGHRYRGLIFAAFDGKPITPGVWATIRPAHEAPFRAVSEDVA